MSTTIPLDVARARVVHRGDGSVVIDDPDSPWRVRAWSRDCCGLTRIQVDVRDPGRRGADITAARLGRLPVAQIAHLVHASQGGAVTGHPNELLYRMLAQPRPRGQRHWPEEHYERVLQVWRWAEDTSRPGGGLQAIADLWGCARNPTASRWLARARAAGGR